MARRLDWTRTRRPRFNQDHEDDRLDQEGWNRQVDHEEARIIAYLRTAQPGSTAFVGDLRKLASLVSDPDMARYQNYCSPIYAVPHLKARLNQVKLVVVCQGWDHLERAHEWVEALNEITHLE